MLGGEGLKALCVLLIVSFTPFASSLQPFGEVMSLDGTYEVIVLVFTPLLSVR